MIDNRLVINENLVLILLVCLTLTICYILLYVFLSDRPEQTVQTQMKRRKRGVSLGSTLFATHPAILDTIVGSKLHFVSNFRQSMVRS